MGLGFAAVALIPTYLFAQARGVKQAIEATETRSTAGLTDDLVEVTGTVEPGPEGTLTHPVTNADALAVRWYVEEDDFDDDDAHTVDRAGRQMVPFRLVDDDGAVMVDPHGADDHLSAAHSESFIDVMREPGPEARTFIERVQENERRAHEAGTKQIHNTPINEAAVHGAAGDLTYRVRALQPGDTGYVLGRAISNGDGTYTIGDDGDQFMISDMDEETLSEDLGSNQWVLAGVAALFFGLAVWAFLFG